MFTDFDIEEEEPVEPEVIECNQITFWSCTNGYLSAVEEGGSVFVQILCEELRKNKNLPFPNINSNDIIEGEMMHVQEAFNETINVITRKGLIPCQDPLNPGVNSFIIQTPVYYWPRSAAKARFKSAPNRKSQQLNNDTFLHDFIHSRMLDHYLYRVIFCEGSNDNLQLHFCV